MQSFIDPIVREVAEYLDLPKVTPEFTPAWLDAPGPDPSVSDYEWYQYAYNGSSALHEHAEKLREQARMFSLYAQFNIQKRLEFEQEGPETFIRETFQQWLRRTRWGTKNDILRMYSEDDE